MEHLFIDSLLEWAVTTHLHLQTRQCSSKDNEDICIAQGPEHAKILVELPISPAEFARNTDSRTKEVGIFTDGSYKMANLTRGSLLVPMDILRRQGVSSAAIVYLCTPEHWRSASVRILQIVLAVVVVAGQMDAFCSEFMGITMGQRVTEGLPYHVTLYSDCMAAIARGTTALAPGARAMGHLRTGPICDDLCQQSRVMNRLIKWIKAQLEKRKKRAEFIYEDWESFLADAAAEGKWQTIRRSFHRPKLIQ
jgi:hypothetical protein